MPNAGKSAPKQLSLFEPDVAPQVVSPDPAEIVETGSGQAAVEDAIGAEVARDPVPAPPNGAAETVTEHMPARAARPTAVTLKEGIAEYKQYLAAMNRSRHTRESFGLDLKLLLEHLGDVPLHSIAERDLRSFISWVSIERHNSPTSVRRKVASLKNFFSYLHRERIIASDPSMRLIYPDIYPALPEFLEHEEVERLIAVAEEHIFWKALITLMLATGLKRDEVVALGRVDVHLSRDESSYLVVRETEQAKRLRSRRLELGSDVVDVLLEYLAEQPERERFFDVSIRGVNFIVETCGKRAGIVTRGNKLTPQILRETFAVRQMRAMVAGEEALRAGGHSEDALAPVIEQHDVQLLRLLGLQEEPESAKKYRKLVRGWSGFTAP